MLVRSPDFEIVQERASDLDAAEHLRLHDIVEFLKRNFFLIVLITGLSVAASVYYVMTTTPEYTAYARLFIDPDKVRIASSDARAVGGELGSAEVESQVQIVKSEAIAVSVIRAFDLTREELYVNEGLLDRLKLWVKTLVLPSNDVVEPTEEEALERAIARFYGRLGVRRVGQSYVIQISYQSRDPERAAKIANATAQAYIQANLDAESRAARSGSRWLETRTNELGEKVRVAAEAVENFRAKNQLVQANSTTSLDQQQLTKISTQLLDARAQTTEFSARLKTLDALLETGEISDVFIEHASQNGAVSRLRQELLSAKQAERESIERYGVESSATRAAALIVRDIENGVLGELQRQRQAYASDLEAAQIRERTLEASLNERLGDVGHRSQALVRLSELTSRAETYRRMYENVLQQFETAVQKASFPVSAARVVSPATVPVVESHPKTMLIVAMAGVLGLAGSLGLGLMRESLDRSIIKPRQIRREINVPFLGSIQQTNFRRRRADRITRRAGHRPARKTRHLRFVLDAPLSPFSEGVRGLMASIDAAVPGTSSKIIGITSVNPGEGKTTLATNLALLFAAKNLRTLILHADRYGSKKATPALRVPAELDATNSVDGEMSGEDIDNCVIDCRAGTGFLVIEHNWQESTQRSAGGDRRYPGESVLKETLRQLAPPISPQRMAQMRTEYDVVLIDLPSLKSSSHARTVAPLVDGIVVVGAHGRTSVESMVEAKRMFAESGGYLAGMVLNKVPKNWRDV